MILAWAIFFLSSWYQARFLLQYGTKFGLKSPSDLLQLAASWRGAHRLFEPYEVFVIERVNSTIDHLTLLGVLTVFLVGLRSEGRLILKLRQALEKQPSR